MVAVILAMSERSCRIGRDAIIGTVLTLAVVASPFAPSSATTVSVVPGETLLGIADEYGTTVAALAAANNLTDPNTIVAGTVLRIPGPSSPVQVAANASASLGGSVVVAAGDTLVGIAHQYGTTVDALATTNNLTDPNRVVIGSVLKIPGAGASAAGPLSSGTSGVTVTVSPGQTLSSIAADHGTTVAMLEAVNGIVHPNLIVSGMQLRLPPASTSALASDIVPADSALPALLRAHPGRVALRSLFVHWAVVEGVSPALLEAMCWWESGWQTYISSVTGALGVCQLEPSTVTNLQASAGAAHPRPEHCLGQHRIGGSVLAPASGCHLWRSVHGTGRLLPGAGFCSERRPLPVNQAIREGDPGLRAILQLSNESEPWNVPAYDWAPSHSA